MKFEKISNVLDQPYGHEIAKELIDAEMSFSEIKSSVDADWDEEIYRILTDGKDIGVIEVPPTKGTKKYTLNQELLAESQLKEIKRRAYHRENNTPNHMDAEDSKSEWSDNDDLNLGTPM